MRGMLNQVYRRKRHLCKWLMAGTALLVGAACMVGCGRSAPEPAAGSASTPAPSNVLGSQPVAGITDEPAEGGANTSAPKQPVSAENAPPVASMPLAPPGPPKDLVKDDVTKFLLPQKVADSLMSSNAGKSRLSYYCSVENVAVEGRQIREEGAVVLVKVTFKAKREWVDNFWTAHSDFWETLGHGDAKAGQIIERHLKFRYDKFDTGWKFDGMVEK